MSAEQSGGGVKVSVCDELIQFMKQRCSIEELLVELPCFVRKAESLQELEQMFESLRCLGRLCERELLDVGTLFTEVARVVLQKEAIPANILDLPDLFMKSELAFFCLMYPAFDVFFESGSVLSATDQTELRGRLGSIKIAIEQGESEMLTNMDRSFAEWQERVRLAVLPEGHREKGTAALLAAACVLVKPTDGLVQAFSGAVCAQQSRIDNLTDLGKYVALLVGPRYRDLFDLKAGLFKDHARFIKFGQVKRAVHLLQAELALGEQLCSELCRDGYRHPVLSQLFVVVQKSCPAYRIILLKALQDKRFTDVLGSRDGELWALLYAILYPARTRQDLEHQFELVRVSIGKGAPQKSHKTRVLPHVLWSIKYCRIKGIEEGLSYLLALYKLTRTPDNGAGLIDYQRSFESARTKTRMQIDQAFAVRIVKYLCANGLADSDHSTELEQKQRAGVFIEFVEKFLPSLTEPSRDPTLFIMIMTVLQDDEGFVQFRKNLSWASLYEKYQVALAGSPDVSVMEAEVVESAFPARFATRSQVAGVIKTEEALAQWLGEVKAIAMPVEYIDHAWWEVLSDDQLVTEGENIKSLVSMLIHVLEACVTLDQLSEFLQYFYDKDIRRLFAEPFGMMKEHDSFLEALIRKVALGLLCKNLSQAQDHATGLLARNQQREYSNPYFQKLLRFFKVLTVQSVQVLEPILHSESLVDFLGEGGGEARIALDDVLHPARTYADLVKRFRQVRQAIPSSSLPRSEDKLRVLCHVRSAVSCCGLTPIKNGYQRLQSLWLLTQVEENGLRLIDRHQRPSLGKTNTRKEIDRIFEERIRVYLRTLKLGGPDFSRDNAKALVTVMCGPEYFAFASPVWLVLSKNQQFQRLRNDPVIWRLFQEAEFEAKRKINTAPGR